jgi:prepilin-type processing-associated H-X9-DG protein
LNRFSGLPRAFTLVELLTLIAVITLLVLIAAPAVCKTKPNGRAMQCLSNHRRLIAAWQMYTDDNHGRLVTALHGGCATEAGNCAPYTPNWASGWLDWGTSPDNTNTALFLAERSAKLARYVNGSANIYRCPADTFVSPVQAALGWSHRVRSYSGDIYVGEGNAEEGPIDYLYSHIRKVADFLYPTPADAVVFLEEHPDSINDTGFFPPHPLVWIDLPATFHNGACTFSMADGHAEVRKWRASLTSPQAQRVLYTGGLPAITYFHPDADVHWVSYHSPRNVSTSY